MPSSELSQIRGRLRPERLAEFLGVSREQVEGTMGAPDFKHFAKDEWSYFFTSPTPFGQRGGGHPELSLAFGAEERVVDVECHYAR